MALSYLDHSGTFPGTLLAADGAAEAETVETGLYTSSWTTRNGEFVSAPRDGIMVLVCETSARGILRRSLQKIDLNLARKVVHVLHLSGFVGEPGGKADYSLGNAGIIHLL